jgi:hypothetical protein
VALYFVFLSRQETIFPNNHSLHLKYLPLGLLKTLLTAFFGKKGGYQRVISIFHERNKAVTEIGTHESPCWQREASYTHIVFRLLFFL